MTDEARDFGARGRVRIVADAAALAHLAAGEFAHTVRDAIAARGWARVALSGGSTPKRMSGLLAEPPYREQIDWARLQVFWGDERWAPETSAESNAGEARRALLDHVPVPPAQVHPFDTRGVEPVAAARAYEDEIRRIVPPGNGLPAFDLILLGIGDDGHTASLFPGTAAVNETARLAVAHHVPKLDTTRLTFTPPLINAARRVIFLVSGPGKAAVLRDILIEPRQPQRWPAQVVHPTSGDLLWLVDRDAAAALPAPGAEG